MALRKPIKDNLISAALIGTLYVVLLVNHGLIDGSIAMAKFLYTMAIMYAGYSIWASIANRQLCFEPIDWLILAYIIFYVALSLALDWPSLKILTAIGAVAPLVVNSTFSLFKRFGWL
jgi:hypothetical protein